MDIIITGGTRPSGTKGSKIPAMPFKATITDVTMDNLAAWAVESSSLTVILQNEYFRPILDSGNSYGLEHSFTTADIDGFYEKKPRAIVSHEEQAKKIHPDCTAAEYKATKNNPVEIAKLYNKYNN